ncbi:histone-fold-containing protein [Rhizopogon salebrosus TDB-379]|nr:histone-fold-containing protein [Rhizopogon salebrosus TDB-379]
MSVSEAQAQEYDLKSTEDIQSVDVVDEGPPDETDTGALTKKRKDKEPAHRERELGKSLLPFSRVQKIIKADKELPIIARDATFLISLATEEFIRRLSEACQKLAEREKRATVQQKDIASVVRRAEEFMFLDEIIAFQRTEPPQKRKPRALENEESQGEPTMLDRFVTRGEESQDPDNPPPADIVMDEDGAMYAA